MASREDNLATLKRYLSAVSTADADQILAPCTDDFVYVERFSNPSRRIEGKEAIHAYFAKAAGVYQMALELHTVHECVDPDKLIIEYTSEGKVVTTGETYANEYIGIYRFRDGLISMVEEFHNSARTGTSRVSV